MIYVLDQRGDRMTVEEVQKIIDEVDENRDGKLNYKEVLLCNIPGGSIKMSCWTKCNFLTTD